MSVGLRVYGNGFQKAEVVLLVVDGSAGIGMRNEDCETDRLFGIFGRVVHRPIRAPRSEQNSVRKNDSYRILAALRRNGLYARTETFHRFGARHIASHIPMTGAHGVAGGEVD